MLLIHLTGGLRVELPDAEPDQAASVVEWFRDARPDQVISIDAANGVFHCQKRHMVQVVVA